jgi:hypothetical protein
VPIFKFPEESLSIAVIFVRDMKNVQALERSVRRLLEIALSRAPEAFIFFLWSD